MGLLDDAIREHLDLKRRRGADPAEVERAEREALGPVRRVAEGHDVPELEFEPAEPAAPEYDERGYEYDEPGLEFEDELGEEIEPQDVYAEPPASPPPMAAEPLAPEPVFEPVDELPVESDFEPPPEPPLEPAAPVAAEPQHASDETVEYDVEEALEAEQAETGEDVLEETPEFLQDTPDHDRLWFEQKPPRDFDFDG